MRVHICVVCRNKALWPASTHVFKSVRVGFPDADIKVQYHGLDAGQLSQLAALCADVGAEVVGETPTAKHALIINDLLESESEPFWICDTDVHFYDKIPEYLGAISGQHINGFICPYTKLITHPRPHTAVMRLSPTEIKLKLAQFRATLVDTPFGTCEFSLRDAVVSRVVLIGGTRYLHDTMSHLASAIGYTPFSEQTLDCYHHANCGTYSDLVDPSGGFSGRNARFFTSPESYRGHWRRDRRCSAGPASGVRGSLHDKQADAASSGSVGWGDH